MAGFDLEKLGASICRYRSVVVTLPDHTAFLPTLPPCHDERVAPMLRTPKTLTLLAAAVGVPYTASETDIGRATVNLLSSGAKSVSAPVEDYLASSRGSEFGVNTHRDVERIWEDTVGQYRYSTTPQVVTPTGRMVSSSNRAEGSPDLSSGGALSPAGAAGKVNLTGAQPSLVGRPVSDLREVLRFDISPQWVTERFSRVTTVLAELHLDGLRVPLVTGTGPNDLAGSISYYFDHSAQLQRVMLHGFTGDPSTVVATMTQHYGLQSEPSLEAGVYTKRWNGMPVHFLRITRAPVVYSDALHHKFIVFLELNQPDLRYGISPEAQRMVTADRSTGRW